MEDKIKIEDEALKIAEAISGFTAFASDILEAEISKAPKEEQEKLKKQVESIKNKELKDIDSKLNELQNILKGK